MEDLFQKPYSLGCLLFALYYIQLTSSITPVNVSSEDLLCWTPKKPAWIVTCGIVVPDDAYVSSVQVTALDQFMVPSIIASCSLGAYTFTSFAQFMGQSGSPCPLPRNQSITKKFRVPFVFSNVVAESIGLLFLPIRNISCGAVVYSHKNYKPYFEQLTQDLVQCEEPLMELPTSYVFNYNSTGVVTCSAGSATPESRILMTITSAANQSLSLNAVTGVNSVSITINTSLIYHRASITCTVLNHAHYMPPRRSEILVNHIIQKVSVAESSQFVAAFGDVLNCSDRVHSYPEAKFHWYIDDKWTETGPLLTVARCNARKIECVAQNSAASTDIRVAYPVQCWTWMLYLWLLLIIPLIIIGSVFCCKWKISINDARGSKITVKEKDNRNERNVICCGKLQVHKRTLHGAKKPATSQPLMHDCARRLPYRTAELSIDLHHPAILTEDAKPWSDDDIQCTDSMAVV